jgi:hypothetical protein
LQSRSLAVEIASHRVVLVFIELAARVSAFKDLASRLAAVAASSAIAESKPDAPTSDHHDGHEEQAQQRKDPDSVHQLKSMVGSL